MKPSLSHHTHPNRHFPPSPHHHLQIPRQFLSRHVAPRARPRRVRLSSPWRSAESGSRHARPRPNSSRATYRQPPTDQRGRGLSAGQSGLCDAESSKLANIRHTSFADRCSSPTATDARLSELTHGGNSSFESRPHAAHGSEARKTTAAPRKRCEAPQPRSCRLTTCDTIRSQRCRRCTFCRSDTPLRDLRVGDTFQDRRQPGHQGAAPGDMPAGQQPPQGAQPVPQVLPNCPTQVITLTERDKGGLSPRHGMGRKASKEP